MNLSTPGLPVHHQLPEFTQTHVHLVGDAIQPSHPLSSPSPPALNPSQHQGLYHLLARNQVIWAGLSSGGTAPHVAESSGSVTGPSRIQADLSHMSGISAEITRGPVSSSCLICSRASSLKTSQ